MIANHLWQSTAFAAAAALLALGLRGNHARTRHCVWLAASLKFLAPFAILAALGSHVGSRTAVRPIATAPVVLQLEVLAEPVQWGRPPGLPTPTRNPLPDIAMVVWACGSLFVMARWWNRWRGMHAVVRAARPMAIDFPIPVRTSPAAIEPGIFGVFRPVLLLPEGIAKRLTPAQLRAILAHELCHARRRDNLWAAAHMLVEALFWFHPLVWWIGTRLVEERERACDEEVVASGGEPEAYAEGILAACKLYLESPLACVAGVGGGNLRRRIERIMGGWLPQDLSRGRRVLIGAAAAAVLAAPVAIGFLRAPVTRAQAPAKRPKFEVASIKPVEAHPMMMVRAVAGRLSADAPIRLLMQNAYGLQSFQISGGPGWLEADHYQIEAKADHNAPRSEIMLMLQTLLEERFQLRYHRESREQPVYELAVAKNRPKLAAATGNCFDPSVPRPPVAPGQPPTPPCGQVAVTISDSGSGAGQAHRLVRLLGGQAGMAEFTRRLAMLLGREVFDRTGLTGTFDIDLSFVPDAESASGSKFSARESPMPPPPDSGPPADTIGPSLATALQEQLGLKLESGKGPVEVMVIDHVERPSEN